MKHDSELHNEAEARPSDLNRERYKEEAAAELAVPVHSANTRSSDIRDNTDQEIRSAGRATGWAALILSIMSWFVWPVLLGITGAVVGYMAYRQGSRGLGVWSITLGLIAAAAYLVLIPLYYAVT